MPLTAEPSSMLGWLIGITIIYFGWMLIIYPAFLSPLSSIPNAHPSASISPLWILRARFGGKNNKTIHEAHKRFGPIVRLGPSEISINCIDGAIKDVYGAGFPKHDWYPRIFGSYGTHSMFAMTCNKNHSARKRLLTNIYSKSFLQESRHLRVISSTLVHNRLLPLVHALAASGGSCNILELNQAFTMDFVSSYLFGLRNGTDFQGDAITRGSILRAYFSRKPFDVFYQETPKLTALTSFLNIPIIPRWRADADKVLGDWGLSLCKHAEASLASTDLREEPLVYKRLKQGLEKADNVSRDPDRLKREVACETLDHLTAGFETTAVGLTYLVWELSRNLHLQQKLREELLTLSPELAFSSDNHPASLPEPRSIDKLPLLDAVIMETLRLHAPIPGMQPRQTPKSTVLLGNHVIPPHTRVNAQAYSLHRNEDVFPNAETWLPQRWIKANSSAELIDMKKWFWAFGSGGRMCVGSNLALQGMKLVTAAIYTRYTTAILDDRDIEAIDAYTVKPKGNKLLVKFENASNETLRSENGIGE